MREVRRGLTLVTVMITLLGACYRAAAQVATTTIQDTVYRADGTPASGTVVVSWPAFTTAAGQAVAAGNTSVTLGPNGALTLALTANVGATPDGSYYTAVLHLDDGTTSQQYWVVPVSGTPVTLSTIESEVLPTSVAMQTASRAFVQSAIAQAQLGGTTGTTFVPTTGGTMTGPLVLPGDPVTPTQAADKHYVDTNITQVLAGVGQKVSMVPVVTQTVSQPAGTQLQVNALNGELYASQFQTGDGDNGIANALASPACGTDCSVVVDPSYTLGEPVFTTQIPNAGRVIDLRNGEEAKTFVNPVNPGNGNSTAEILNQITTNSDANTNVAGSGVGSTRLTFSVSNTVMAGGDNQLPGNIESPPYGKANYGVSLQTGNYYSEGQHVQDQHIINCYAVGDCLQGAWFLTSAGGYRDVADEGAHPFDLQVVEDNNVFQGTCSGGCTSGSTSVFVVATVKSGTQGEGRFLIDKNPAETISSGQVVSRGFALLAIAGFTGTNFPVSVFMQTAATATSQPKNLAPGTVTLPMVASGAPAGFAVNTSQLPAPSGVACVADTNDTRFPNFETANYSVVDASHITFTLNKVHAAGAVIAVGGLCGYGIEQTVDTVGAVRQVFPVVGSTSATSIYYAAASTPVLGDAGDAASTSGYQNISLQIASASRHGNVVTATLTGNMPVDVNGLTMTVSGVADASYNGSFQITSTGANQLTYSDNGPDSTSTGGSVSLLTGGYVLYPMAEVLSVYDGNTKAVDGLLTLAANTVVWAPGDAVEVPHYYQQLTAADTELITQYVPRPIQFSSAGKQYTGEVGPGMRGWQVQNGVPASNYVGGGGTHELPDDAYVVSGPWTNDFEVDAGTGALIRAHCNLHGCNRWNSGYSLFALDSATGEDFLFYSPSNSSVAWSLGGQSFTFAPNGFSANTLNATTINATTIAGGAISGTTVTGRLSSGSGAAGVFLTNNHVSDAIQVESQDPTGYSTVGLLDNTGTTNGSFGYANPSAQSILAGTVFFNSVNHTMTFSTNSGVSPSITIDPAGNITFDGGAEVSNSGVMSAKQVSAPVLRSGTAANTDLSGTLTVSAGATSSSSYSFAGSYGSAPVCIVQPQSATAATVAAIGAIAPQVSTATLSVSVQTAPASAITFGYHCVGRN